MDQTDITICWVQPHGTRRLDDGVYGNPLARAALRLALTDVLD